MNGKEGVVECAFVKSEVADAPYFSTPILLGRNGVERIYNMGELSDYEKKKLEEVNICTSVQLPLKKVQAELGLL